MLVRAILVVALLVYAHQTEASETDVASLYRGDAFRLCLSEILDCERITAWMRHRKEELSPGCKTVFINPKSSPAIATANR